MYWLQSFRLPESLVIGKYTRLIVLGLVSLIIIFMQYSVSLNNQTIYWKGWYLLEIAEPLDLLEVTTHLRENGVHDFLAASNAVVPFMAIPEIERKTVDFLEKTLTYGDPRRDPFISLVGSLFKTGDHSLVFLPSSRPLGFYTAIITKLKHPDSWKLLDNTFSVATFFRAGIFILFVGTAIFFFGKNFYGILSLLPQIFPWLLFTILSHTASPYIGAFFLLLTFEKFNYNRRDFLLLRIVSILGILGIQFYLCIPAERLELFLALAAFLFIMLVRYALISDSVQSSPKDSVTLNMAGRDHTLFIPVKLSESIDQNTRVFSPESATRMPQTWFIIIMILLFLSVLFLPYPRPLPHNSIPSAGRPVLDFDDWSEFRRFLSTSEDFFPHVVSLLMSRSYQEGFIYGATYRMPELGESLVMERYVETGNTIKVGHDTLIKYNDQWFDELLTTELKTGVGLLYASIGGVASIRPVEFPPGTKPLREVYIGNVLSLLAVVVYRLITIFCMRNNFQGIHLRRNESFFYKYLPKKISSGRASR